MDLEYILFLIIGLILEVIFVIFAWDKIKLIYKRIKADGKIELSEVIEAVDEITEIVEDAMDEFNEVKNIQKMKKDELMALCEKHGLDTNGTKAQLIENLKERVKDASES